MHEQQHCSAKDGGVCAARGSVNEKQRNQIAALSALRAVPPPHLEGMDHAEANAWIRGCFAEYVEIERSRPR
jgi:hypothetical protein